MARLRELRLLRAGQLVTQRTYPGRDWRTDPALAAEMFRVFAVVRQLHEIRVLLADPACAAPPYAAEAADLDDELARLAGSPPETLLAVDVDHARRRAGRIFSRVAADRGGPSHRGAWLMGADLRDLDLTDADLLGADLRGADLSGADLRGALFLTQPQLDAARGDARTLLPDRLTRPAAWAAEADPAAG